jgi:hypothetical protein
MAIIGSVLICGARLCPQDQPQRSAMTHVWFLQHHSVCEALRLVFQTRSAEGAQWSEGENPTVLIVK